MGLNPLIYQKTGLDEKYGGEIIKMQTVVGKGSSYE